MSKKLIIGIDITDWRDEMQIAEPRIVQDEDDIIALVADDGYTTTEVGKIAVVQEEMSITKSPILISRKAMIKNAARIGVNTIIAKQKELITTDSGREYSVRKFVSIPKLKDITSADDVETVREFIAEMSEKSIVPFDSDAGITAAVFYLTDQVPGHIWNRLAQICGAGGDVEAIAEEVKAKIDEMVDMLE